MRFLRSFALTGPPRLAAALLAIVVATQSASAVMVEFQTTGEFGGGTTAGTDTYTGLNGSELLFLGVPQVDGEVGPLAAGDVIPFTFGSFDLDVNGTDAFSGTFTLFFEQFEPTPGGPTPVQAALTGSVQKTNIVTAPVTITFDDTSLRIGNVVYTLNSTELEINPGQIVGVAGTISVVPLPAAAWGGMALFGVLGGAKLRRSRQSVMA